MRAHAASAAAMRAIAATPLCGILPLRMDDEPEYLICLQCETPTYQFEFVNGKLATIVCAVCGADDPSDFVTEAEYDEQTGG
jgi:hypothetical protein